jgi:hypothetical protein
VVGLDAHALLIFLLGASLAGTAGSGLLAPGCLARGGLRIDV